jgi:hypothetical protein
MIIMRRLRFFAAMPTRGTSIEERLDANPAGRTIVSSFDFRCGTTVGSKRVKCSTELHHCIRGAYQWRSSGDDDDYETNCFYQKIVSRFVPGILTADIPKTRRFGCDASPPIPIERHRAVIAVNQWRVVALASNY